jgi:hypothetical protein
VNEVLRQEAKQGEVDIAFEVELRESHDAGAMVHLNMPESRVNLF